MISNKNIQSPLGGIDETLNLDTAEPRTPVEENCNINAMGSGRRVYKLPANEDEVHILTIEK